VNSPPKEVFVDGEAADAPQVSYDSANKVLDVRIGKPFVKGFSVRCSSTLVSFLYRKILGTVMGCGYGAFIEKVFNYIKKF